MHDNHINFWVCVRGGLSHDKKVGKKIEKCNLLLDNIKI